MKDIDFILHAKCLELLCHLDQIRTLDNFNYTVLVFLNYTDFDYIYMLRETFRKKFETQLRLFNKCIFSAVP